MKLTVVALVLCMSNSIYSINAHALQAQKIAETLTVRQKIAQLIIAASVSNDQKNRKTIESWQEWASCDIGCATITDLITEHEIGGIIFYGERSTAQEQRDTTNAYQKLSKIPLFIALDAETTLANRLDDQSVVRYPTAMGLSAADDTDLTYEVGKKLARELRHMNVTLALCPVADVNNNPLNPIIGTRSFGSDPSRVAQQAVAFMQGVQSEGIIACAKHFPGHGDTSQDSHEQLPTITHTLKHLEEIELYPFQELIDAGIKSIMLAHLHVPALDASPDIPSSLSKPIVTELLQNWMDFKGLIITDALAMKGATSYAQPGKLELLALQAGADILLCPANPVATIDTIEEAITTGSFSEEVLNAKVIKVLTAKLESVEANITPLLSTDYSLRNSCAFDLQEKAYNASLTAIARSSNWQSPLQTDSKAVLIFTQHGPLSDFEKTLSAHDIPYYSLSYTSSPVEIQNALNQCKGFDQVCLVVEPITELTNAREAIIRDAATLKKNNRLVTTILLGSPYFAPLFKTTDGIIIAYSGDSAAQRAIARVVVGNLTPTGILPVTLNFDTLP